MKIITPQNSPSKVKQTSLSSPGIFHSRSCRRALLFVTIASMVVLGRQTQAALRTWNNTGTDFNTPGNWTGALPGSSDVATFTGAANTSFQPNVSATISISAVNFSSAASSGYSITATGTNALVLGSVSATAGAAAISSQNTSGTNTISASIILGAAGGSTQTFTTTAGGTLIVSGNVSSTNNVGLSLSGSGTTVLSGSNSFTGGLTFAGASSGSVFGIGNDYALGSGTFTIVAGSASNAIQSIGGAHTISNAVSFGTNFTISGTNDLTISGLFVNSGTSSGRTYSINNSGLTTLSGGLVLSSGTAATSSTFQGTGNILINSTISDTANTIGSNVAYNGSGVMTLSGSNTFRGNMNVGAGATILLQNNSAMGASGGGNTVSSGATLALQNNITITGEVLTINGTGVGGNGALRNISDANTFGGTVTLLSASVIKADAGTLTLSGSNAITSAAAQNLTLDGAGNINVTGTISTGAGTLTKTGSGTATLSATNTYSGVTTVSGGVLSTNLLANVNTVSGIGKGSVAGSAADLVLDGGTLRYTGGTQSTNRGFTVTTNGGGLDASGLGPLTITGTMIASATSGTQTLALSGTSTAANTLGTAIVNGAGSVTALNKIGAGTWNLSGSSTYTGATTVQNGTLNVVGSLGNTAVTVGNAGTGGLTPVLTGGIGSVGGTLGTPGNSPNRQVYASSGTVGNISGSVTVSGSGAGTSAGTLSPGNGGVGTLTVGALTLSGGSILNYEFNSTANDFTVVTGALSLNSGTAGINLFQESGTAQFATAGVYDLFQYGSLVGSVNNLTVLNQNAGFTYVFGTVTSGTNNYVTLTISPAGGGATSTTYSLSSAATTAKIFTSGSTSISSTITNTGTGTADTLDFAGLGTTATSGSIGGSTTSGTGLAKNGGSSTNSGLTYTAGTTSGTFTVNPVITSATNHTAGGSATLSGSTAATVSVYDQASLSVSATGATQGTPANLILTNGTSSGGASGQRAGVTVVGVSASNVLASDNTNNFAAPATTGSAVADAHDTTTSATVATASVLSKRLNGTYTETVTGTTHYTDSTLAGQQSVANQVWNITASISGNSSTGRGDVYSANVLAGKAYGTSNSSGFSLNSNLVSSGHQVTTATLLNGALTASATTNVNMSFDKTAANSVTNAFRASDILTLSGLNSTSPVNSIQITDVYVLQLSYDPAVSGVEYLGWNNGTQFVNAISGDDSGNTTAFGDGNEVTGAYSGQTTVGTYGYDPTNHVVWAVLDHGGFTDGSGALIAGTNEFAAIPEPGTWEMCLGGFGILVGLQRIRKRITKI